MSTATSVISIYQESTPNPQQMKFVVNRMLYARKTIDFPNAEAVQGQSNFADGLFKLEGVKAVFIANNFVTIGKTDDKEWLEIIPEIKAYIKSYIESEQDLINLEKVEEIVAKSSPANEDSDSIEAKIKDLLAKYVQPAVEMDGGSIVFRNYQDGIVTLGMQGACSGCPSSTITLKAGIEGMMKRMIPDVKEVIAENM